MSRAPNLFVYEKRVLLSRKIGRGNPDKRTEEDLTDNTRKVRTPAQMLTRSAPEACRACARGFTNSWPPAWAST